MAIAYVKKIDSQISAVTGVTTQTLTVPTGGVPIGGHIIIAGSYGSGSAAGHSFSDSRSNTYLRTRLTQRTSAQTQNAWVAIGRITTALLAGDTITVTSSISVNTPCVAAHQFSGLASTFWSDTSAGLIDTVASTTPSSTSVTTSAAAELIIGVCAYQAVGGSTTFTAGSGYTQIDNLVNAVNTKSLGVEYKIVSTTGSYSADGTISAAADWAMIIAAYSATAITPTVTAHPKALLMVA